MSKALKRAFPKHLLSFNKMTIYMKDKDLDKSKYKPSELDQINNYLNNYAKDDPKALSDEEKQKLIEKAERLQEIQK